MVEKLTTWQCLRNKFPESECVLIEEVSNDSGFSRSRSIDFMVINLWPSRGLSITGIEKKSNRGDWLNELKNPIKQESHFKFCDYFYLITDKDDVARLEEIPNNWGWFHKNGNKIKTMKDAPKLDAIPVTRGFLCAMLRRAAAKDKYVHIDSLEEQIDARVGKKVIETEIEGRAAIRDLAVLQQRVKEFEEASMIDITHPWIWNGSAKKLGESLRFILDGGIQNYEGRLKGIADQAKLISDNINDRIKKLHIQS